MKILKLFTLVLAITIVSISCSKDDDNDKVSGNKYETTYAKITATVDGVEQTIEFKTIETLKENELYLKVDFRTDNTFWVYEISDLEGETDPTINSTYEWSEVGTWTQKDSKITITLEGEQTLTATVDGNKLIMIIDINDVSGKKLGLEEKVTSRGTLEWHFTKL